MTDLNERVCANCGGTFNLIYTNKKGYKYKLNSTYCSKSCAVLSKKSVNSDTLEKKALDFIVEKNEYCTTSEICQGTGHSSKTFSKHGIKIQELNHQVGFKQPISKFQNAVKEFLEEEFPVVETEKRFDGLVGKTGSSLRVDFYIPNINMVIEADGSQHKDPNHPWKEWKNGTVPEYDKIKDEFFLKTGMGVCRIPYKRNLKKSDVLSRLNQSSESHCHYNVV